MSLAQKGVRSTMPAEHLENMQRNFQMGYILRGSKFFGPQAVASSNVVYSNDALIDASYIPLGVKVRDDSAPLPLAVIEELIRRSPHRIISNTCTCRHAYDCKEFDKEIGCIHIGAGTWEESDELCHHATVEEALDHLHMAVDKGLMPFIGRIMPDHIFWDVNMENPFLTVCLCCECCCTVFKLYREGQMTPDLSGYNAYKPMEGLHIDVDEKKCVGCGTCAEKCISQCIKMENKKPVRNMDLCKGCSACNVHCPEKAVNIWMDDIETSVNELLARLDKKVGGLPLDEYKFDF